MISSGRGVLLDTCAVIWMMNGTLKPEIFEEIVEVSGSEGIYVSPVSAWEIGMLSRPKPGRGPGPEFLPDVRTWFTNLMNAPGIKCAELKPDIAIEASYLPGIIHNDPADRLLVATARVLGLAFVTRDDKIIAYGAEGHVQVIDC